MKPDPRSDLVDSSEANDGACLPERRLLAAMVERAFFDCLSSNASVKQGAIDWLFSEDIRPFSLLWVLSHFSDSPQGMQQNLKLILGRWRSELSSRFTCGNDVLFAVREGILQHEIKMDENYHKRKRQYSYKLWSRRVFKRNRRT